MVRSARVHGEALDWLLDHDSEEDRNIRSGLMATDLSAYSNNSAKKRKKRNVQSRNKSRKN